MRKPRYLSARNKANKEKAEEIMRRLALEDERGKKHGLGPRLITPEECEKYLYPLGLGRKLNAKIMAGRIKTLD